MALWILITYKSAHFPQKYQIIETTINRKTNTKMVILRSGKDVPFLGKNIPKRNQKQTSGQLSKQQLSKASQNAQIVSKMSTSGAMKSFTSDLPKHNHTSTCADINTTDSTRLELTENLASEDTSMMSDSDIECTMIDDTLEITNYEDSHCMNQSNPYFSNSQVTEKYHDNTTYQCEKINDNARLSKQSNICGVADLSWF